jgi:outer membrane protein OmpA-like peptidoglycan-associated protein
MRIRPRLVIAELALAATLSCLAAPRGQAQVDQRALDQLGPAPAGENPAEPPTTRHRPTPPAERATEHDYPNGPHQTLPPLKPRPPGSPPRPPRSSPAQPVPPGAPPAAVLPPPLVVPSRQPPTPLPPAVTADAPDIATALPDGLRVSFGPDRSDLNPVTEAALRALVHDAPPGPDTIYTVTAYAAGSPDDPSTPRRLSLARALTVRSVLIGQGVASVRIYVKALGALAPTIADGPPDRVDIVVTAPPRPATPPAAAALGHKATP